MSCSVAEMCSVKFRSRSQKAVFCPSPWRVNARGSSDQIFKNSSHKWICVQVWLRSVQWLQSLGGEKKKKHNSKILVLRRRDVVWAKKRIPSGNNKLYLVPLWVCFRDFGAMIHASELLTDLFIYSLVVAARPEISDDDLSSICRRTLNALTSWILLGAKSKITNSRHTRSQSNQQKRRKLRWLGAAQN